MGPALKAFYDALLARHKTKLQALMAVARKLLHAIYGIFNNTNALRWTKTVSTAEYLPGATIGFQVKRKRALLGSSHAEG